MDLRRSLGEQVNPRGRLTKRRLLLERKLEPMASRATFQQQHTSLWIKRIQQPDPLYGISDVAHEVSHVQAPPLSSLPLFID